MDLKKIKEVSRFAEMCLNIASVLEKRAKENNEPYLKDYGYGYRVLVDGLRKGVKNVIDMQMEITSLKDQLHFAKIGEKTAHEFLYEIFGEEDIYTLNDEYKAKIKEFVQNLDVYKEEVTE